MQCNYFDAGRCRSCTLMGVPYGTQLAEKERRVRDVLAPFTAGLEWLPPVASPASHFRNKAKLVVAGRAGRPTFGILDPAGRGVDLRRCGLYEPGLAATFDPLHRVVRDHGIEPYDVPARRGELKHLIVTHSPDGEHLVRFVVRSEAGLAAVRAALPDVRAAVPSARVVTVNLHPEHKAVLEGATEVVLTEDSLLPVRLDDVTLHLGPRAFFQTNTAVTRELYAQARSWADALSPAAVTDLYCGVGGFALHLAAPGRRVTGVESAVDAVEAARFSAGRMTSRDPGPRPHLHRGRRHRGRPRRPGPRGRQPPATRHRARARGPPGGVGGLPRHLLELQRRHPRPRPRGDARPAPGPGARRRHVPADAARRDRPAAAAPLRLTRRPPQRLTVP